MRSNIRHLILGALLLLLLLAVCSSPASAIDKYPIFASNDISIDHEWGTPGEMINFTYSSVTVEGKSQLSILKVESAQPISIQADTTVNPPWFWFLMPSNYVGLTLVSDESGGPTSAGTAISYLICRVTVTADPGITFRVKAMEYDPSTGKYTPHWYDPVDGKVTLIMNGDELVSVYVTSHPSGTTLSAQTYGVAQATWSKEGSTDVYTILSYSSEADLGDASVHIVAQAPVTPTTPPGSSTLLPASELLTPAIEGIVTDGDDNHALIVDVSTKYPGVFDAADIVINRTTAFMLAVTGGTEAIETALLAANPQLSEGLAAEIAVIIMNAVDKGILTPSPSTMPLIINTNRMYRPIEFYRVFDIVPDAGEDALREVLFRVPVYDIYTRGWTTDNVFLYHGYPADRIWIPLETWLISVDSKYAHYAARTNSASPFAIVFANPPEGGVSIFEVFERPSYLLIIILSCIAAVVVGGVIFFIVRKRMAKKKREVTDTGAEETRKT